MSIAPIPRITDDQLAGLADRHGIPTEAMQVIRHIACLYSGGAIEGDPTQLFTTGHYVWLARRALEQIVACSQQPAPAAQETLAWISIADRLPPSGATVLAFYANSHGKGRRIRAEYIVPKTRVADDLSDPDTETVEYDDETGQYYWVSGWYECVDNWEDYSSLSVTEGEVSHWMPLPAAPQTAKEGADHE